MVVPPSGGGGGIQSECVFVCECEINQVLIRYPL